MHRTYILTAVIIAGTAALSHAGSPQIVRATPEKVVGTLVTTVNSGGETLWVGATVILKNGKTKDLRVRQVSGTKSQNISWQILKPFDKYRISLWRKKVKNRKHKMGYVMQGRVADSKWQTQPYGYRR